MATPRVQRETYTRECRYCGKSFKTERLVKFYCDTVCLKRQDNINQYAKRKAKKHGQPAG